MNKSDQEKIIKIIHFYNKSSETNFTKDDVVNFLEYKKPNKDVEQFVLFINNTRLISRIMVLGTFIGVFILAGMITSFPILALILKLISIYFLFINLLKVFIHINKPNFYLNKDLGLDHLNLK